MLIAVDTYLQQVVPHGMRGRVLGTRFTITQGTYALSVLVGGALAGVVDVRILFIVAGAIVAVSVARRPPDARGPGVLRPRGPR